MRSPSYLCLIAILPVMAAFADDIPLLPTPKSDIACGEFVGSKHLTADVGRILQQRSLSTFWRWLFAQDVPAEQLVVENQIVRLDYFLSRGNPEAIAHMITKFRIHDRMPNPRDLASVFRDTEHSQVLIHQLWLWIDTLETLARKYPSLAPSINALTPAYRERLEKSTERFVDSFSDYVLFQKHFLHVIDNPECDGLCETAAKDALKRLGINDPDFAHIVWLKQTATFDYLRALGIAENDVPESLREDLTLQNFDRSLISPDGFQRTIADRALYIRLAKVATAKQRALGLTILLSEPVITKVAHYMLSRIPVAGPLLKDSTFIRLVFKKLFDTNAVNRYFHPITVIMRDPSGAASQAQSLYSRMSDPRFIETVLRRSDAGTLRIGVLKYLEENPLEARKFPGLLEALSDLQTSEAIKKFGPLAVDYRMSPVDHLLELGLAGAGLYLALDAATPDRLPKKAAVKTDARTDAKPDALTREIDALPADSILRKSLQARTPEIRRLAKILRDEFEKNPSLIDSLDLQVLRAPDSTPAGN